MDARNSTDSTRPSVIRDDSTRAEIIEVPFGRKKGASRATSNYNNNNGTNNNTTAFKGNRSIVSPTSTPQTAYVSYTSDNESALDNTREDERIGGCEEVDSEIASVSSGSPKSGSQRRRSAYEEHSELVNDIQNDIKAFFSSSSVLSTYMSSWAKAFLIMTAISVILTITFGAVLLAEVYERSVIETVDDGSICEGAFFDDPKGSTLWYNVALIFLANVFMIWYAFRGVALEKWGTSVCFIIAALTAVGRVIYTVSGGLLEAYKVPSSKRSTCTGGLVTGALIALGSLALLFKALREFGWRNYVKGATTPAQVSQMNRYQLMDLFLKLDVMLCVHTIVSIFFAVSSTGMIIVSGVVIAVTVGMLVLVSYFIKKQITWFVYAFVAMCPAMPLLYIYLIVSQSMITQTMCMGELTPCLYDQGNITVGASNYSDHELAAHTYPSPNGVEGSEWFLLPEGCYPINTTCGNTSLAIINDCCARYGHCQYTQEFFRTDQVLLIMLAVAGVIVRILTVISCYKRMKEMDIPSIRELLERGDRNIRSFALIFVRNERKRAASSTGIDDDVVDSQLDSVLMR